ncbi:MAG: hypothetical protein AB1498_12805 [bacterium]
MNIKETYQKIIKIKRLTGFNRCPSVIDSKFDKKNIPSGPPISPENALLTRQLAVGLIDVDEKLKAQWENYWIRCCLSRKCDYIFSVLVECGINREKDILDLLNNGKLWNYLGSESGWGKEYYINICIKFLLSRYAWFDALNIKSKQTFLPLFHLSLPKLWGSILIGIIPFISSKDLMGLPGKLTSIQFKISIIFMFLLTLLYFLYECHSEYECFTDKCRNEIIRNRALWVFLMGIIYSFVLSYFICKPILSIYIADAEVCKSIIYFTASSLFIGILLQVFWQEKTITEPL